jgi:hypothetical protein
MAHAQKPDFVFRRNGRVHLNRQGRQFSRLLAAEVCPSAVVILDTPCSGVVWRVLATHSIHQFSLHFPSRASPCAITFQLYSTNLNIKQQKQCRYNVTFCPVRLTTAAMVGSNTSTPFCRWYPWSCEQCKKCSVLPCKCNNRFPSHPCQATKFVSYCC